MTDSILTELAAALTDVRAKSPLVHHITNYVTVNDCANITLAVGASPIMADAIEEAGDIAKIASSLVLNIGTLNSRTIEAMLAAGESANGAGVPIVLDPVGAGASTLRTKTAETMLSRLKLTVLRGNLSEIRCLAGLRGETKGVDAGYAHAESPENIAMAQRLARELDATVAITGAVDVVTDGTNTLLLHNGHPMLSRVTGTGCMTTSLVGSFVGAGAAPLFAATGGILTMGIAGETAFHAAGHVGTGSFRAALIDAVSLLDAKTLEREAKVYVG